MIFKHDKEYGANNIDDKAKSSWWSRLRGQLDMIWGLLQPNKIESKNGRDIVTF